MLPENLAAVDWPFAALLAFFVFVALCWPQYRRLAREMHVAAAAGDYARSLDAELAITRSYSPIAVLERWIAPGDQQALVALRYLQLGEFDEALAWTERALRKARRDRTKAIAHCTAALARASRGDVAEMDEHLRVLEPLLARRPVESISFLATALTCNQHAGRLEEVERLLRERVSGTDALLSARVREAAVWSLITLGQFEQALQITGEALNEEAAAGGALGEGGLQRGDALGLQQLRAAGDRFVRLSLMLAGADAAAKAQRWDLFEEYIRAPVLLANLQPGLALACRGYWMMSAAHSGDSAAMARCAQQAADLIAAHPRNRRIRATWADFPVRAWQIVGDQERALAAAQASWAEVLAPLERSELAAAMARSLDALGRVDQAEALRAEARALALRACWNRESEEPLREDLLLLPLASNDAGIAAPASEFGPVAPAASPLAGIAWIVAVFAMIPVVGVLGGVALLVLSILLLTKRQPLLHDRRVGRAGMVLALISLAFAAVSVPSCGRAVVNRLKDRGLSNPESQPDEDAPEVDSDDADKSGSSTPLAAESSGPRTAPHLDKPVPWHQTVLYFVVLGISIVLHEIGHGVAAFWAGDPTARDRGRFSLNPIRHFSLLGSLIVPGVLTLAHSDSVIGWAKPVPIRPECFRHARRGLLSVTLAGVSLNMLIALAATNLLLVLLVVLHWIHPDVSVENLLFPFQMVEIEAAPHALVWAIAMSACKAAVWINVFLTSFNLLPFPPLDGFGVIRALAPRSLIPLLNRLSGIGMMLMLALIVFKALDYLLLPGVLLGVLLLGFVQFVAG
ncbi:MAG TPA: site-2 protease family protein [Phycisphaerae bacterium]|jgi:Zn-dependent protease